MEYTSPFDTVLSPDKVSHLSLVNFVDNLLNHLCTVIPVHKSLAGHHDTSSVLA